MPGAAILDPTPKWLKAENASVTDSALTKALRMIGHLIGADNPSAQALGLMMTDLPAGGAAGGVAGALERLIAKGKAIKAYHGSPHDFERFSMEKIGTGEGAQAYGHGLYFAENEDVAYDYRNRLSAQVGTLAHKGEPLKTITSGKEWLKIPEEQYPEYAANDLLTQSYRSNQGRNYTVDDYVNDAVNSAKLIVHRSQGAEKAYWQQVLDKIESKRADIKIPGKMYEVAIKADPESFLDWDKPLSQQSEKVRAGLIQAMKDRGLPLDEQGVPLWVQRDPTGESIHAALNPARLEGREAPKAAATLMQKHGIAGVKYLDQGSRSAGQGSRNYVVNDDRLIEVLKKYGLIAPTMGLGSQADDR